MIGSIITSLFLLNAMCPYVDLTEPVLVNACPKNQSEVMEASKRLKCGNDTFGNNQYLCLPNKNKTSLIEFCFDGVMGIHDEGICLEVFDGKLIYHSCYNFLIGCPDTHFYDYEFYKYPACQEINTTFNCYVSDPTCSRQLVAEKSDYDDVILYTSSILGGLILIVFVSVCIILGYLYREKNQTKRKEERSESRDENPFQQEVIGNDESLGFLRTENGDGNSFPLEEIGNDKTILCATLFGEQLKITL